MNLQNAVRTGVCLAALTLAVGTAQAQDFYNGVRGPKLFQLDNYVSHSDRTRGTFILKVFTKNGIFFAAPITINENGVEPLGLNFGYIEERSKKNKAIFALGLFKDSNREYRNLVPQFYATREDGEMTYDLEGQLSLNTKSKTFGARIAATVGRGFGRWRIGGSAIYETGKRPLYQGIIRFEVQDDHSIWAQAYVSPKRAGVRLAINLK